MRGLRWTRRTALSILILLLLMAVAVSLAQTLTQHWGLPGLVSVLSIGITSFTTLIAYIGIPAKPRDEARRKTEEAINDYPQFQDSKSLYQRNTVIDRMRREAPYARYSDDQIIAWLRKGSEGERYAALASIQWQWPNRERPEEMGFPFEDITPVAPPDAKSTKYLDALLYRLCHPGREFEHYYIFDAVWGMLPHLQSDEMQKVCECVDCQTTWKSNKWYLFADYVKRMCAHA